ncbi:MAG: tRNA pseudouridine(13) synthase TruD [Desulfuromonadales bacterium]|nr:tRNA pseudouridine(13) synthase TruD [Desulfuromonadales bacterium]
MPDYLTAGVAGIGGTIKETATDFCVEEVPLYRPCGAGEHLYLWVEKTGMTTFDLVRKLARACRISEREIGYAGMKDARATTRQWLSLPAATAPRITELDLPGVKVLETGLHGNKLRLGHLAGNRFEILIRGVADDAVSRAEKIFKQLEHSGVPNLFGEQRYGILGNSHRIGRAILGGDFDAAVQEIIGNPELIRTEDWRVAAQAFRDGGPAAALPLMPRRMNHEYMLLREMSKGVTAKKALLRFPAKLLRLYLSACQAALFDRLLTARLPDPGQLLPGDIACKHANGACFRVTDLTAEQARADAFEISPTAPLFGHKVMLAEEEAGRRETAVLHASDLTLEAFRLEQGLGMAGERRPLRVPVDAIGYTLEAEGLRVRFMLPKGSFATSLLRELMKTS